MFYLADYLRISSPGHSISDNAAKTVLKREGRVGEPGHIRVFATKDQVVGTSEDDC